MVCDFDIMMQKKKEENRALQNKRRKAKDIDMINDNDDAIAKVLNTLFLESRLLHVCVLVSRIFLKTLVILYVCQYLVVEIS